jgi:fructokinase
MTHTPDPRIVCLGESIVDLIGEPDAGGRVAYRAHPGGSPLNAAVAAARLGAPTAMLTRFSDDAFGAQLRDHLSAAGVDLRLAEAGPEPTSMAVVTIDAEGRATYGFYRAETADVSYDPRPRPALPPSVSVGNVTVSLLREPSRTAFHDIVRESGRAGRGAVTWVLDPNARPALWSGPDAFGREFAAWVPLVDVIKVSDEDLAYLGGEEGATAAAWLAAGVTAVVVTAGADGARLYRPGHAPLIVPGRRVDVVDTVGAGDTFTAGLTTGLVDRAAPARPRRGRLERVAAARGRRVVDHLHARRGRPADGGGAGRRPGG